MNDLSPFKSLNLPIDNLVMLVFYFIIGIYAIFSAILYYHWKTYGTDIKISGLTLIIYFITTIPLLIVMGIMAFIIS